jgi:hypothetical protein
MEGMLKELRHFWVRDLGVIFERTLLLDTKPVAVVDYKRGKGQSDFIASADYEWCASRKMKRLDIDVLIFEQHPVA